jgi:hypothetical protein
MTSTALDAAIDDVLGTLGPAPARPGASPVEPAQQPEELAPVPAGPSYIHAVHASRLFADPAYQRPLDEMRVQRMAAEYDPALLGVIEVSDRGDGRFAIIDGQHRWALVREAHPDDDDPPLVCNVHRGLTVEDEARLFYEIDAKRRNLTGWDRWWARRGAGDPTVLAIEQIAAGHGLRLGPQTKDGMIRATRSCEEVVKLGGTQLLDSALSVITAAYGVVADGLDGQLIHGVAHVVAHYERDELDMARLVDAMQAIAPRQVKARAGMLREAHKGDMPRLVGAVLVDRYNSSRGRKVEDFFTRVPPATKNSLDAAARRRSAIRQWARRTGHDVADTGYVPKMVVAAYEAAHSAAGTQQ